MFSSHLQSPNFEPQDRPGRFLRFLCPAVFSRADRHAAARQTPAGGRAEKNTTRVHLHLRVPRGLPQAEAIPLLLCSIHARKTQHASTSQRGAPRKTQAEVISCGSHFSSAQFMSPCCQIYLIIHIHNFFNRSIDITTIMKLYLIFSAALALLSTVPGAVSATVSFAL